MKGLLSEKEQKKMEKMLKMGFSHDDVVNHFMEEAEKDGGFNLRKTMEIAMKQKDMSDEELISAMQEEMGEESKKDMEKMLASGESAKEVVKKMMQSGKTKEEEMLENAETINHLMKTKKKNIKITDGEAEEMVDERFDDSTKTKLKKVMQDGKSMKDAIKNVIDESKPQKQMTEMEKK